MRFLSALILFLSSQSALAASCCGGGFSFPALILGEDKHQLTGTISASQVADDVLHNGLWLKRQDNNKALTLKMEAATLISDQWQAGITLPLITKNNDSATASHGLGDTQLFLGHESFPERVFSKWKPKGVSFLQLHIPSATSIYDGSAESANESRGRGFFALGAGVALVKPLKVWDFNYTGEIHHSFEKSVDKQSFGGKATLKPGLGTSHALGVGWNSGAIRIGSAVSYLYEEAIEVTAHDSFGNSAGSSQQSFTASLLASYMPNMESSFTFSYADQTLLGNPSNTSLTRTLNFSYQQRWPR